MSQEYSRRSSLPEINYQSWSHSSKLGVKEAGIDWRIHSRSEDIKEDIMALNRVKETIMPSLCRSEANQAAIALASQVNATATCFHGYPPSTIFKALKDDRPLAQTLVGIHIHLTIINK